MCEHEEVLDSKGYVFFECGVVLDQEYVYGDNCFYNETDDYIDHNSNSIICTILDHLNLNHLYLNVKINDLIDKYLSNFRCKIELKVGACIYYILFAKGIPCQLNRISGIVCSNINDTKKFFKLIQTFPQQNISSNDTSILAEFLLSHSNFSKEDKDRILQLIDIYSCKFCSYSPVTQIAGISYIYFKEQVKQKKSLKTICNSFLISQNSVHLYLNHSCAKNWDLK